MAAPTLRRMTSLTSITAHTAHTANETEELTEADWAVTARPRAEEGAEAPRDWLFWAFLMCVALAALPLLGIRWALPQEAFIDGTFEDAVLLSLPVIAPLPFLFIGCLGTLVYHRPSRTAAAFGVFAAGVAFGAAALLALLA